MEWQVVDFSSQPERLLRDLVQPLFAHRGLPDAQDPHDIQHGKQEQRGNNRNTGSAGSGKH